VLHNTTFSMCYVFFVGILAVVTVRPVAGGSCLILGFVRLPSGLLTLPIICAGGLFRWALPHLVIWKDLLIAFVYHGPSSGQLYDNDLERWRLEFAPRSNALRPLLNRIVTFGVIAASLILKPKSDQSPTRVPAAERQWREMGPINEIFKRFAYTDTQEKLLWIKPAICGSQALT